MWDRVGRGGGGGGRAGTGRVGAVLVVLAVAVAAAAAAAVVMAAVGARRLVLGRLMVVVVVRMGRMRRMPLRRGGWRRRWHLLVRAVVMVEVLFLLRRWQAMMLVLRCRS